METLERDGREVKNDRLAQYRETVTGARNAAYAARQATKPDLQRDLIQAQGTTEQRAAPQVAQSPLRADQLELLRALQSQAAGLGPSWGEMAINRQRDAGMAQQQSMMASARPDLAGVAGIAAGQNNSRIAMDAAGQASIARLQEQQQAQQLLAGYLGQLSGQDLQLGQMNSGLQMQQLGLNDARLLELMRQRAAYQGQGQQYSIAQQQLALQRQQLNNQPGWFERMLGTTIGPGMALLGGLVGGPPGAMVGGAAGAALGSGLQGDIGAGAASGGAGYMGAGNPYYAPGYAP